MTQEQTATAVTHDGNGLALQRHYIDGAFRASRAGGTFESRSPATNEVIAVVADGQAADVDDAVAAARRAFDEGPWPRLAATERAGVLRRIAALIRENADEFIRVEVLDTGVPISQARGLAARAAQNFDYYAGVITELHGRSFQVGDEFLNYTIHKPAGVTGLIMPWNAPLMLSTWRLAPALAAGNTVVLKPAEWAPVSSTLLAEVLEAAGLPKGVFNVVHGFGETAGAPLSSHPGVNLICFTGEPSTGSLVIAAGAPTLKRSSVELGGKSPVRRVRGCRPRPRGRRRAGADLHDERPALHRGLAPARAAAAVRAHRQRRRRARAQHPRRRSDRSAHRARAADHRRSTTRPCSSTSPRRGPTAPASWPAANAPPLPERGNYLEATVIADVDESMRVFQEEIFGPVLVAMPFDDEADAIRLANATPLRARGLRLDERHPPRAPRRPRDRHRHVLDQLAERARPAHAVRRRQELRHRPRGRRLRVRVLLRPRDRARRARLAPHPADGTRHG